MRLWGWGEAAAKEEESECAEAGGAGGTRGGPGPEAGSRTLLMWFLVTVAKSLPVWSAISASAP